ncbi:MAG: hypothetical protein ACPHRC_05015 [Candidatus Puniceispirillales bacterium]
MKFKALKKTIVTALICSGLGFGMGAIVAGLLVTVVQVFAPNVLEEDPNTAIILGWFMMWTSIVTMMWVRTNGLPDDN